MENFCSELQTKLKYFKQKTLTDYKRAENKNLVLSLKRSGLF